MKRLLLTLSLLLLLTNFTAMAASTHRTPQFENDKVDVWKTVIYPSTTEELTSHRHDQERVLVALSDGTLKITNNHGAIHYLKLEKDHAYYLSKDPAGEMHTDENISHHPITVMVIALK